MSRIFDALRASESERSGSQFPDGPTAAHEVIHAAESDHIKPTDSLVSSPCHECGSLIPDDGLFCPKCDSFQGASAAGNWGDSDSEV
jgi:hypothetical protein